MATVTPTDIKDRHPEFTSLQNSFIQEKIDKAYRATNAATLGEQYDDAAEWLACLYIASSPMGAEAALLVEGPPEVSFYRYRWKEIARPQGAGWRV